MLSVRGSCCDCPLTLPWRSDPSADLHEALDHIPRKTPMRLRCAKGWWRPDCPWLVCLCNLNTLYISSLLSTFQSLPRLNKWQRRSLSDSCLLKDSIDKPNHWTKKSKNIPGRKEPWKIIWSNLSWERDTRWDYLAYCPVTSWKPLVMGIPPNPWGGCSCEWLISLQKILKSWWSLSLCSLYLLSHFLLPVAPSQERAFVLPVAALSMVEYSVRVPWALISREKRPNSSSLPSSGRLL